MAFKDLDIVVAARTVRDDREVAERGMLGTVIDTWPGGAEVEFVLDHGNRIFSVCGTDADWALATTHGTAADRKVA